MLTAEEIRALVRLEAHPLEGGFFVETWRSRERAATGRGERSVGTAIYYLLTSATRSSMHRLPWDEVFHFYLGDPVEILLLEPGRAGRVVTLGADLAAGQRPQVVVPAGVWQGSVLSTGGRVALLGTTMAPGFDSGDFESGSRAALVREWPQHGAAIRARTRSEPATDTAS
jgi:predicted cupin superfamily sugar epimerase